jgi:molecular chaperone GrpE
MENQKHDHPHGHNHKHDIAAGAGRHEHKETETAADDAIDLENLKNAGQPHNAAERKPEAKEAAHKAGQPGPDTAAKTDSKGRDAEILAQKQKQEIDELKVKNEAANDKYLRLMAEFDNFKRRTAKEYQQLIEQANEKLMKDIIDVRENFERAFKHHKQGADPVAFIDGMKMIFTKLDTILHKHGLEVYCEPGQAFDPELHDAMMKTAHDTVPDEHIAEVCEKGYRLKGKVIKHSKVIVSSGKSAGPAAEKKISCDASGDDEAVIEVSPDKDTGKPEEKQG